MFTTITGVFTRVHQYNDGGSEWTNISGAISTGEATVSGLYWDGTFSGIFNNTFANTVEVSVADYDVATYSGTYIIKVEVGIKASGDYPTSSSGTVDIEIEGEILQLPIGRFFNVFTSLAGYNYAFINGMITTTSDYIWYDVSNVDGMPGVGYWDWHDMDTFKVSFYPYCLISGAYWSVSVDDVLVRITYSDFPPNTYGLECWNSAGEKILSVTDRITRVVWSKVVSRTSSGNEDVAFPPGINTTNRLFGYAYSTTTSGGYLPHNIYVRPNFSDTTKFNVEWSKLIFGGINYTSESMIVVLGW